MARERVLPRGFHAAFTLTTSDHARFRHLAGSAGPWSPWRYKRNVTAFWERLKDSAAARSAIRPR
jgi:hypothetical protein